MRSLDEVPTCIVRVQPAVAKTAPAARNISPNRPAVVELLRFMADFHRRFGKEHEG
ncbi:hypothetical protein [Tianweitania sp.]|uniref:hypothetical protein n=1 Tax=Tianweitania sp. TaxID=2021634 RepID=UPI00289FA2CA|nr:hypothetical protein [Tianweitania sp.]